MTRETKTIRRFRSVVWAHYKKHGRHELPWRRTRDAYKILVSEVMLQQTQVERVVPFYRAFLHKFPTPPRLARAPLSEVLRAWQGLGYNRRAKLLQAAAKEVVARHAGRAPRDIAELERLPGVGPYTARAIASFAFNTDTVCIETNIRTAIIHHFFPRSAGISSSRGAQAARPIQPLAKNVPAPCMNDRQIMRILKKLLPRERSREWNLALMDYGAHLKKSGVRVNARSTHYNKQAKFEGSMRQARGAILKELAHDFAPLRAARLLGLLGDDRRAQLRMALAALAAEGLVARARGRYVLAEMPPSLILRAKGMPRSMRVPSGIKSS